MTLRRLEIDALKADLAAVEGLLASRSQTSDPIGFYQFAARRAELAQQIEEKGAEIDTAAAVGLFFGGRPVAGSYGIQASFGAKAVDQFQMLVTNYASSREGPLKPRGPARQSDKSQLMITDVGRGSFGFILEESTPQKEVLNTELKSAVRDVLDVIFRSGSADEESFDGLTEAVDDRVLSSLRNFFTTINDAAATIRLVQDNRDFSLDRADVGRAHDRIAGMRISETTEHHMGKLYLLPESMRFELHSEEVGIIKGTTTQAAMTAVTDMEQDVLPGLLGNRQFVMLKHRTISMRNRADRHVYTFMGMVDRT